MYCKAGGDPSHQLRQFFLQVPRLNRRNVVVACRLSCPPARLCKASSSNPHIHLERWPSCQRHVHPQVGGAGCQSCQRHVHALVGRGASLPRTNTRMYSAVSFNASWLTASSTVRKQSGHGGTAPWAVHDEHSCCRPIATPATGPVSQQRMTWRTPDFGLVLVLKYPLNQLLLVLPDSRQW